MKEPLKLPFVFLFILLCSTIVLSALDLFSAWGMLETGSRAFTLRYALQRIPRSALEVMIPSFVLSIVLVGFRMARRPISRFLGLLIVLGVSYIALVNGMIWMRSLAAKTEGGAETPRRYLRPYTFLKLGEAEVAAGSIEGGTLRGILLVDSSRSERRFSVFPSGIIIAKEGAVTVTLPGRKPGELSGRPNPSGSAVFAPDRFTARLLGDVRALTADFERLLAGSLGEFFAACFALLFLCTASLALLRLTRWPLANIMLLVLAVRGYFLLYHFLAVRIAPEVARAVRDPLLVRLLPAGAMAAIGIVLLLLDILFIPPDRWRQGGAS